MKKILQRITGLVALSTWLVSHAPAFAAASQVDHQQGDGFFDVNNKEFPWHFGLKGWAKVPFGTTNKRVTCGIIEFAIGPTVEWKPLNGLGLQSGLLYSKSNRVTANVDSGGKKVPNWSSSVNQDQTNIPDILNIDQLQFHALSIPFSFRFYPGDGRQFILHVGPRLMIVLGDAKQATHCSVPFNGSDKERLKKAFNTIHDSLKDISSSALGPKNSVKIGTCWTWDFGFDYNTKSGFIIGMSGLGLTLGYDFIKLLS